MQCPSCVVQLSSEEVVYGYGWVNERSAQASYNKSVEYSEDVLTYITPC